MCIRDRFRHFGALTCVAFLTATTLLFADRSRHLNASLNVREATIAELTKSDFEGELEEHQSFATAREIAASTKRLVAIGFSTQTDHTA